MSTATPRLVVVTGRPGSGKTTLAHALARQVRCPALCRDEVKEGYVHSRGTNEPGGAEANRRVYDAFFDAVEVLLRHGVTLVAEAAFQHKLWAPRLEPMQALAQVRIIVCDVPPELARRRHIERGLADPERERSHDDAAVRAAREGRELPLGEYDPPRLGVPTLRVDTSDGYQPSLPAIRAFALAEPGASVG